MLERIKALASAQRYRIRIHAVRHMIEEGFDEENVLEALTGKSRILENYPSEMRCLVVGTFAVSEKAHQPIHVVCDYSNPRLLDIVTAYLPHKPRWVTPTRRGRLT